ncbi:MAG: threonine-phosphate decarboxylase [Marinospirillum sp.]|uniref:threonine-phosphate decarboxylase CobD n=1 Tax=Marinospirillum sp. TaxID=2183934 RepID=UPI0019F95E64|nr:threonine-phosphate decarboxylase CobD [Marinospirillum sp.]MBE0507331.1 threonine-phosphate decarboxylase [Marinospirillum sp.]
MPAADLNCAVVHGGRLRQAAQHYAIPLDQWLDLSTGINPQGWPVPHVPAEVWQRLPEEDDGLQQAMTAYYASADGLAVPGSQVAIQCLPELLFTDETPASIRVALLSPAYSEHSKAWQSAGFDGVAVTAENLEQCLLDDVNIRALVLIQPNNPTGVVFAHEDLQRWHRLLMARKGWLVVDEAFLDALPQANSMIQPSMPPGLVVLRSLGKFFGLAGLRLGFVFAENNLLQQLQARLGLWAVSHPARYLGRLALLDDQWQQQARQRLKQDSQRLFELLQSVHLPPVGGTPLFQWVLMAQAKKLADRLAQQGILVRSFEQPSSLRFGLPQTEAEWQRLEQALQVLQEQ